MRRRDLLLAGTPAFLRRAHARPLAAQGVQSGDVLADRAIVWSRADRSSRMMLEWSTRESMAGARRITGPYAMEQTGFTARMDLRGLPPGQSIFYRVQFLDLSDGKTLSEPVSGHFRTAPAAERDVRFLWSGDTAGQGYGINPDWGGMRIYETMRKLAPDFFLHSGDTIYADNPIPAEIALPDGTRWRNLTTEATGKVAETLDEFRGNYLYNLMDENVRRFNAEVPQIWQWDDHEVMNNWSPGKDLSADAKYREKSIPLLVARATRAFLEFAPMRFHPVESGRIFRRIPYGPLLDVFVIDMRSYRAANSYNRQPQESEETAYLGRPQIEWLKRALRDSKATWKVIASDMPLGLVVPDGRDSQGRPQYENSANGDGPPLGREFEIASLLRSIQQNRVRNTVWLTADVHYTAAHYFDPAKAQFKSFDPFWEFVSGPLNSGTFGPGVLENTFGPQVMFQKAPDKGKSNLPPSAGLQFFGEVKIEAASRVLVVNLRDVAGQVLYTKTLNPAR